jgi:hypothetical protein
MMQVHGQGEAHNHHPSDVSRALVGSHNSSEAFSTYEFRWENMEEVSGHQTTP